MQAKWDKWAKVCGLHKGDRRLLTDSKINALKAGERLQRLADGGGLYIEVAPTGAKTFRLRYYHGKDRK